MNKYFKIYALTVLIASWICFTYTIITAWLSGDWKILMNFNSIGEGYLELIISLIAIPFIILLLKDYINQMSLFSKKLK